MNENDDHIFEIGYYIARSKIFDFKYNHSQSNIEINYHALRIAHLEWRNMRGYDKVGESC